MAFACIRPFLGIALAAAISAGAASGARAAVLDQVTDDDSGSGCTSSVPVASAAADIAAWQSDCDPASGNGDGSLEIFRAATGAGPTQITAAEDCSSLRPSMSDDGARVAFESNCNLTGSNGDGNVEIYVWDNGTLLQRTTSVGCDNLAPSISGDGKFVAFDSTCNLSGTNNSGRGAEIFRVTARGQVVLKQLTDDPNGGACDSTSPSTNGTGSLVAFDSDCDLAGTNPDSAVEVFTVTGSGVVSQRTFAPEDSCSSVHPAIDAAGSIVAFHSNCNFTGINGDLSDEVFTVDSGLNVRQVSAADESCASGEVRMASSGNAVVFSSYCKLNGYNADGNIEVFHAGVGNAQSGIFAVSDTNGACNSVAGGPSADGTLVMLDSDCDLASDNDDGSVEVFRASACACGSPSTRKVSPKGPLTSDALFTLQAAVGSKSCAACECDTDASGSITTSDAQRVLKAAVGQAGVTLVCPEP